MKKRARYVWVCCEFFYDEYNDEYNTVKVVTTQEKAKRWKARRKKNKMGREFKKMEVK